jgi:hypothetical protein
MTNKKKAGPPNNNNNKNNNTNTNTNNNNNPKRKEQSYFSRSRRRQKHYLLIIIPIIAAIIAIGAISTFTYTSSLARTNQFGKLGSAHEHAAFMIKIDGTPIDFNQQKYMVKSSYIHVENSDGTTLHRHSTSVPFGEFLRSVGMNIDDNKCFVNDNGQHFCDGQDNKRLQYFVNGTRVDSIMDYVIHEGDRILVEYGNETDQQVKQDIDAVNRLQIRE